MFEGVKHVHFVGIGGIGISALARMFIDQGAKVSGSDRSPSIITVELAKLGAKIYSDQKAENLEANPDLVIYTIAILEDNPELARARELGLKMMTYPEALGELSKNKFTIAVAGTHGKTTTTAMIAEIMVAAGLDPTVIVGSLLKKNQSNFIAGKSNYLVVEACEFKRSFLNLWPKILVITNIDNDHLDYYKDLDDIKSAFSELAARVPEDGKVITEKDYLQLPTADLQLQVPGQHNIKNAQAALAVSHVLGIEAAVAVKALENFSGTWRRFEYRGELPSGAKIYDDYAHHPTEIRATLTAARELTKGKIIVAFHPHLYSRTKLLFKELAQSLSLADQVFLVPIFAAREKPEPGITSEALAEAIVQIGTPAQALGNFEELAEALRRVGQAGDLIITMGAGDIYKVVDLLL